MFISTHIEWYLNLMVQTPVPTSKFWYEVFVKEGTKKTVDIINGK